MNFRISGNNENIKWQTLMTLVCFNLWMETQNNVNKQHHAENMDVKKIVF